MSEVAAQNLMLYANTLREALPNIPNESRIKPDIGATRESMKAIAKNTTTVTGAKLYHALIGGLGTSISQLCLELPSLAAPGKHGHRGRVFRGVLDPACCNATLRDRYKPVRDDDVVMANIVRRIDRDFGIVTIDGNGAVAAQGGGE